MLSLAVPEEHNETFRFTQGQYLTCRASIDGEVGRAALIRSAPARMSRCSASGSKRSRTDCFRPGPTESLRAGQQLEAMPPMGNFFAPLDPANRKHYAGFASGSGITPLLSIMKTTLVTEPHSSFSLFYGNRASSTIMFREELEELKNEHLQRVSLTHILSREHQDVDLFNGRIGKEKCRQLFQHWLDVRTVDTAFICGPQDMMLQVSEALQEHGLYKR